MNKNSILVGEMIGTFLIVFFGCGSLAAAVLTGAQVGIFQVAIVWGIGVALAIFCSAGLSGAHLNPAVTLAMVFWRNHPWKEIPRYLLGQFLGAFLAAGVIYFIFSTAFTAYEEQHQIQRGTPESVATAMIFGEYYPNPGGKTLNDKSLPLSTSQAFGIELIGTMILVFVIFTLTDPKNPIASPPLTPILIGLTVTILISLLGPLTMCGLNPARDFAPRLFSSLAGWGSIPFQINNSGWWLVYGVAPVLGGIVSGALYEKGIKSLESNASTPS